MCTLHLLNRLSKVYLFGPLERENGRLSRGDHGGFFLPTTPLALPSRKEDAVVSELQIVVGGEGPLLDDKAGAAGARRPSLVSEHP